MNVIFLPAGYCRQPESTSPGCRQERNIDQQSPGFAFFLTAGRLPVPVLPIFSVIPFIRPFFGFLSFALFPLPCLFGFCLVRFYDFCRLRPGIFARLFLRKELGRE